MERRVNNVGRNLNTKDYLEGCVESMELHMFGDSSQDVFSAVAFLRGKVTAANRTSTELAFVFGKARVAPMKALTIPKLELQASLLAARLRKDSKCPHVKD